MRKMNQVTLKTKPEIFKPHKGQAILETAIFGALILMAIVQLFSYTQRLNEEQYVAMSAFRGALKESFHKNAQVSYTVLDHRRFPSADFFRKGARSTVSSSATVFWAVPDIDDEIDADTGEKIIDVSKLSSLQLYSINNIDNAGEPVDLSHLFAEGKAAPEVNIDTSYTEEASEWFTKKEDRSGITTQHTLGISDEVILRFVDKDGKTLEDKDGNDLVLYYHLDKKDGRYVYKKGGTEEEVERNIKWTTPH